MIKVTSPAVAWAMTTSPVNCAIAGGQCAQDFADHFALAGVFPAGDLLAQDVGQVIGKRDAKFDGLFVQTSNLTRWM